MSQLNESIQSCFCHQIEEARASLQDLAEKLEPEFERLKQQLEALENLETVEYPPQSLSFAP